MAYHGGLLGIGSSDGTIKFADASRSYAVVQTVVAHTAAVTALAFSSNGKFCVSGDASGKVVFTAVSTMLLLYGHSLAVLLSCSCWC